MKSPTEVTTRLPPCRAVRVTACSRSFAERPCIKRFRRAQPYRVSGRLTDLGTATTVIAMDLGGNDSMSMPSTREGVASSGYGARRAPRRDRSAARSLPPAADRCRGPGPGAELVAPTPQSASAISAFAPCPPEPAGELPSAETASITAGSEPPSRSGTTYLTPTS